MELPLQRCGFRDVGVLSARPYFRRMAPDPLPQQGPNSTRTAADVRKATKPLVIGIAGGSGSGKSHLVHRLQARLPAGQVLVFPQDAYYHDRSDLDLPARQAINFDAPQAIDFDYMVRDLDRLVSGQAIALPDYDYWACRRSPGPTLEPAPIIVVEGILVLTQAALRERMDHRLFIDIPEDLRLIQLVERDKAERGRTADEVLERYQATVGPMHHRHVLPSREHADWIWTRFAPGQSPWPVADEGSSDAVLKEPSPAGEHALPKPGTSKPRPIDLEQLVQIMVQHVLCVRGQQQDARQRGH